MTIDTAPTPAPNTERTSSDRSTTTETRTARHDLGAVPTTLRSDWIKLSTLRANRAIVVLTVAINGLAAWAVATLVTDEVLTVSEVFVFPALLTSVLASIMSILMFTSEAQHGTLATAMTAQPARWVIAASKMLTSVAIGVALGAAGMVSAAIGAAVGGLSIGDTASGGITALYALLYITLAALIGLGVGMIARHSAAAISGLLVWSFVGENLILAFAAASFSRFLPFDAGYRMLGVGSEFDTPEILAVALTRPTLALLFTAYAVLCCALGTAMLYRRDIN